MFGCVRVCVIYRCWHAAKMKNLTPTESLTLKIGIKINWLKITWDIHFVSRFWLQTLAQMLPRQRGVINNRQWFQVFYLMFSLSFIVDMMRCVIFRDRVTVIWSSEWGGCELDVHGKNPWFRSTDGRLHHSQPLGTWRPPKHSTSRDFYLQPQ